MPRKLTVNLIARDNGLGLSRDLRLLSNALKANGCDVHVTPLDEQHERRRWALGGRSWRSAWRRLRLRLRKTTPRFDINIMFEHLWPDYFALAPCNIALPNPEWFDEKDRLHLDRIERAWVKTHHAEPLLNQLGCSTTWIGFASEDCRDAAIVRQKAFFHLAGGSRTKGTARLVSLWREHPEWPTLTVACHAGMLTTAESAANVRILTDYLSQDQLRQLQNAHAFHMCLSETEGYGHYICEAMSVGAIAISTDAAPMNELVDDTRGLLVAATAFGKQGLATLYQFDSAAMEQAVAKAIHMDDQQIETLGTQARTWFVDNDKHFSERVGNALREWAAS